MFMPSVHSFQAWRYCKAQVCQAIHMPHVVWNLMQIPISITQLLSFAAQLMPSLMMYSQCSMGLQEVIQQELQHEEIHCLLILGVLQCWDTTQTNDDIRINTTTQTSGRIRMNGIMELDQGCILNDDINGDDPKDEYDPSTMC
jgi:hypothetical protein